MFKIPFAKSLFWMTFLLVLALSVSPGVAIQVISVSDKLMHFLAFLVLTILFLSAYKLPYPYVLVVLLLGGFGLVIEYLQHFIPYRSFSMLDFVSDVTGVIVGILLYKIICIKEASV